MLSEEGTAWRVEPLHPSLEGSRMDDAGWEILSMLDVRSLPYAIVSFAILFSNIICQPAPNE